MAGSLDLPPRLTSLIATGAWPTSTEAANRQHLQPMTSAERVARLAPDESTVFLYPPPFRTVAADVAEHGVRDWSFWNEHGAIDELDPTVALIIGDFGPGSDSPIVLDYRGGPSPRVLRLRWPSSTDGGREGSNTWVTLAESFDQFVEALGLSE